MAVDFVEIDGSPTFGITQDGWQAQRTLKIAWQDIDAFIQELLPPTQGSGTILQGHTFFPGKPWLLLSKVDFAPFDGSNIQGIDSNGVAEYDIKDDSGTVLGTGDNNGCRVSLEYSTTEFSSTDPEQDDPVPFLTTRWNISGEFLQMKGEGLQWNSDSADATEDGGVIKIVTQIEHVLLWHFVINAPFAAIRANINRVNKASFLGADPETLLFAGAGFTREIMTDGSRSYTMEYRFLERIIAAESGDITGTDTPGWNHHFRTTGGAGKEGKWERVKTKSGGKPYPTSTDFANLFQSA